MPKKNGDIWIHYGSLCANLLSKSWFRCHSGKLNISVIPTTLLQQPHLLPSKLVPPTLTPESTKSYPHKLLKLNLIQLNTQVNSGYCLIHHAPSKERNNKYLAN